jgi:hypothetical protein
MFNHLVGFLLVFSLFLQYHKALLEKWIDKCCVHYNMWFSSFKACLSSKCLCNVHRKARLQMMTRLRKCWMNCNWLRKLTLMLINQMSVLCRPKAELMMMKQSKKCWMTCPWSRNLNSGQYILIHFKFGCLSSECSRFLIIIRKRII